jgi:NAD(P)-dependent dehydrogenase (short-subunit alcohol dehydrogenase family)
VSEGLEGAVAIVTGAAGGIGSAVVARLLEAGASVVAEDLDPAVARLEGDRVASLCGDAAQADTAQAAVELALGRFGGLDVVVNNAGRFLLKALVDTRDDEWDGLMATNVRSAFVHCRAALPILLRSERAAIVNTCSISGVVGLPQQGAYAATKGAIAQITRQLAIEHAAAGVRVNAIAPGAVDTAFVDKAVGGEPDPQRAAAIAAEHPLGRMGTPDEIARAIVFLASPAAAFITGAIVMADGGFTAR